MMTSSSTSSQEQSQLFSLWAKDKFTVSRQGSTDFSCRITSNVSTHSSAERILFVVINA